MTSDTENKPLPSRPQVGSRYRRCKVGIDAVAESRFGGAAKGSGQEATDPKLADRVLVRKVFFLLDSVRLGPLSRFATSLFVFFVYLTPDTAPFLVLWMVLTVASCAGGYAHMRSSKRDLLANPSPSVAADVSRRFIAHAAVGGLLWGSASAYLFLTSDGYPKAIVVLVACLVVVGSVPMYATVFLGMAALVTPTTLILAMAAASQGTTIDVFVGLGLLMIGGVCLQMGRHLNQLLDRDFVLGFRNEALLEEARTASLAKTKFFAAASHDLRQPIHAIELLVSALQHHVTDNASTRIAAQLRMSAASMSSLINALLDLSKLDAGVVTPEISEFRIDSVVNNVIAHCAPEAQAKGISLRVVPSRAIVRSDPMLVERIVRNLLTNAIAYTSTGGVLLGCRIKGSCVSVEVWDQGPGIAEDKLDSVFAEFVRLNPGASNSQGSLGLGLSIVQRSARLLGTDVVVRSRVGKGSVFSVALALAGKASEQQPSSHATPDEIRGAFLVVVDDDEPILTASRLLLEKAGCHVVCARSGKEAVVALEEHLRPPDLILSDMDFGGDETGLDVVAMIRKSVDFDVPAIFVTAAQALDEDKKRALASEHVLVKPVSEEILMRAIAARLQAAQKDKHPVC